MNNEFNGIGSTENTQPDVQPTSIPVAAPTMQGETPLSPVVSASEFYAAPAQSSAPTPSADVQQPAPAPQQTSYSPYSGYYYPPKKVRSKRAESHKYPLSVLVACCLICALLSGVVASGAMLLTNSYVSTGSVGSTGSNNTVINVEKTSTDAVSAVAEKVVPSVVGIRVTASVSTFFGMSQEASSEGSGVIYTSDGYIITNYHVISAAVEAADQSKAGVSVYLPSDTQTAIDAEVIGYNSESDLAVIKIDRTGLTAVEIGDSDKLEVGELAIAVGNPGGLEYMGSVSSGIISGLNRSIKLEGISSMSVIQTDAAINPGNSGGALVNYEGKLVGINSSKISSTSYEGMGFAIPSNSVVEICENIINNKDVKKAYVGITISTEYTGDILQSMGYPAGAVVESVTDDSPAATAGIRQADIITQFAGVAISDYTEYNAQRLAHQPGEKVTLTVYRNGRSYEVSITLGESDS